VGDIQNLICRIFNDFIRDKGALLHVIVQALKIFTVSVQPEAINKFSGQYLVMAENKTKKR
jgi:hypothetical protein